jgi:hypothetical protein
MFREFAACLYFRDMSRGFRVIAALLKHSERRYKANFPVLRSGDCCLPDNMVSHLLGEIYPTLDISGK